MKSELPIINAMIDEYVCPGCIHGCGTATCTEVDIQKNFGYYCKNHRPATLVSGLGEVLLGLPTLFSLIGMQDKAKKQVYITVFDDVSKMEEWNDLDVPVWAAQKGDDLIVKVVQPRRNNILVQVYKGGKITDLPERTIDVTSRL
jgi:hypothetical protein